MTFLRDKWAVLSMLLAVGTIVASFSAGYYWLQYTDILDRIGGIPIYVDVGIDYGNYTRVWHNGTKALTGMTLFRVTRGAANVAYNTAAGFGVYIQSIDSLAGNATHGWVWWKWDTTLHNWTRIDISSDAYAVADEEIFLWDYQSGWPPVTPS
ncbi:hypothetical protein A3K79_02740 [Candidatus Bathyarchaeota archaeon RBG_13_46_16b]|nr:MAG: hypothetical protein A3K79_02740 [Candidatus Bathyarchaeota archaeon RBG_13_46_16b]